ncbi:FG-GAP repeat protein [Archangium violaceum]|uniref:MopE-related protein n=1 Tax=Archangium violaceum TaxID=83451 RepID=UPI00194EA487|nr:MopE-related protein [Archangium violaceum]QRO00755.1 FG-GAP repeat protein [Archangium violaceum]
MKTRLMVLVSGLALAACEGQDSRKEESSSTFEKQEQALPGDPLCKLTAGSATALPAQAERRFTGLASTRAGAALGAGDVNGDGITDLLIGAPGTGTTLKGYTYVLNLSNPVDIRGYATRIEGEAAGNRQGQAVAAGDFLGSSGIDLILGAPNYASSASTTNQGVAYPVDGSSLGGGDKVLGTTSPRFRGVAAGDLAGAAVAVGDIAGDSGADLIVSAYLNETASPTDTGAVYAFTGPVSPSAAGTLSSAPVKIVGTTGTSQTNVQAGFSIAVADVNGDGKGDLLVGAPRYDVSASVTDAGAVFVFFGPLSGTKSLTDADIVLTGSATNELAGSAVASAGDLDNDGKEDILIGAPGTSTATGKVYLVYGGATGTVALGTQPRWTGAASDLAGTALLGPGDINGDGFRDFVIGAPGYSSNVGAVYVVYGGSTRFSATNASLSLVPRYAGAAAASQTGSALVGLGDVDGDGSADFAIGAPGYSSNAGAVYLVLGHGARTWYPDTDRDGYGVTASAERRCGEPAANSGWALNPGDCKDSDIAINPSAAEVCDGQDNNCDGLADDDPGANPVDPRTWYLDADGDSHIYFSSGQQSCAPPVGPGWIQETSVTGLECEPPAEGPANYSTDNDPSVHQFASEVCDGKDNDCNGVVDEDESLWLDWYPDGDGDGYGRNASVQRACVAPAGHVGNNTDCDDADAITNPARTEVCDLKDNNCNGTVDEGVQTTFYRDADGDGHGVPTQTALACTQPTGYSAISDDCNDTPAPGKGAQIYPGKAEVCDGLDNNCNFDTDEGVKGTFYRDADGDGYGNPALFSQSCTAASGYVANNTDCNDSSNAIRPGATEVCDNKDNDCDAQIDEGVLLTFYVDADRDGVGTTDPNLKIQACTAPAGYVTSKTDCDDGTSATKPGATEVCDGKDNDCDAQIDEGLPTTTWYPDTDNDGYGAQVSSSVVSCRKPEGEYVANNMDCDDSRSSVSPGRSEVCEPTTQTQVDNNCSGGVDDAVDAPTWYRDADGDGFGQTSVTVRSCTAITGYSNKDRDCDDVKPDVHPEAIELCELTGVQVDNDCDGDENDVDVPIEDDPRGARLWYGDADRDGHAGTGFQLRWCTDPSDLKDASGKVLVKGKYLAAAPDDCNDSHSGAWVVTRWYEDRDGDGCGNPNVYADSCGRPGCGAAYVSNGNDSNDTVAGGCISGTSPSSTVSSAR